MGCGPVDICVVHVCYLVSKIVFNFRFECLKLSCTNKRNSFTSTVTSATFLITIIGFPSAVGQWVPFALVCSILR